MKKISLFLLTLAPVLAFAQQVDPCIGKGSAQDMGACVEGEYKQANQKMDNAYKKLLAQIPVKDEDGIPYEAVKKQLRVAQKSWRDFVEQDCKTVGIYNKGSAFKDVEYFSCMRVHTEQRTTDFERFLSRKGK